jgi:hypothetical protein
MALSNSFGFNLMMIVPLPSVGPRFAVHRWQGFYQRSPGMKTGFREGGFSLDMPGLKRHESHRNVRRLCMELNRILARFVRDSRGGASGSRQSTGKRRAS